MVGSLVPGPGRVRVEEKLLEQSLKGRLGEMEEVAGPCWILRFVLGHVLRNPPLIAVSRTEWCQGRHRWSCKGPVLTQGPELDECECGLSEDLQGRIMPCAGHSTQVASEVEGSCR